MRMNFTIYFDVFEQFFLNFEKLTKRYEFQIRFWYDWTNGFFRKQYFQKCKKITKKFKRIQKIDEFIQYNKEILYLFI